MKNNFISYCCIAKENAKSMLRVPILFLVFNRPDTTRQVFEAIRQARPASSILQQTVLDPKKEGRKKRFRR